MAEKISEKVKKFFQKKKADAKFKMAGPGHKLNESSASVVTSNKKASYVPPQRSGPSEVNRQAAEAALARLTGQKKDAPFNTSLAAIQAKVCLNYNCITVSIMGMVFQVRRELEAERKNNTVVNEISLGPKYTEIETISHMAVNGINYFIMYKVKTYLSDSQESILNVH